MGTLLTPLKLAILFLAIFIPLGIWASLDTGMAWDDIYEHHLFAINYLAIYDLLHHKYHAYNALATHHDRYYGIGFHAPAYLIAYLIDSIAGHAPSLGPGNDPLNLDLFLNIITFKHISIFLSFVLSGYLVKLITQSITVSKHFGTLAMICFLLWPYLLGHGLMNIKDAPFAFAWLLSTWWALRLFEKALHHAIVAPKEEWLNTKDVLVLALMCAWLTSIRISGILIFLELGIFTLIAIYQISTHPKIGFRFVSSYQSIKAISIFLVVFFLIVYILHPLFWLNPLEFFNAILYQSRNPIHIDTYTAGEFISNRSVGLRYFLTWFLVKLPAIVLLGLACTPLLLLPQIQKRLGVRQSLFQPGLFKILALLGSVLAILFSLRLNQVHLYNDLRHLLFLFPLLFIIGVSALYFFSKKICIFFLIASSIVFAIDDVRLHPYQYTYLNEITRQLPISEHFEKDYFALSASKTASWLNRHPPKLVACIYASPLHSWQAYIDKSQFTCNQNYPAKGLQNVQRPFLLYGQVRDPRHLAPLPNCQLLNQQERTLFGSAYRLQMSRLYLCP